MKKLRFEFALVALLATVAPVAFAGVQEGAEPEGSQSKMVVEQTASETKDPASMPSFFAATTVTATGTEVDVFTISTPVAVIPAAEIQKKLPDNAVDLLRDQPGVDVNGVGPNQERPVIRGLRGLRVLFLENGLRMNNPRRQTDFGEIPGLVDVESVESVEIVRGPASVLYGSDAIGGVLNLITRVPSYGDGLGGAVALRYGSAGDQTRVNASLDGRAGDLTWALGGSYRDASDYEAPAGSYGRIRLREDTRVVDTGVEDDSLYGYFGYQLADSHRLFLRASRYSAGQTGFGFVEPELLDSRDPFRIRILYPFQDFERYTLGYVGAPEAAFADSLDAQVYSQSNERQLANDIDIDIGPIFFGAPNSVVEADTLNFTDLDTLGARAELTKRLGERQLLTYGAELYRDESFNTDSSVTVTRIRFPFPPFEVVSESTDTVANSPNATNESLGIFVQDEILVGDRLRLTLGARYQSVDTRAERTPGWDVRGLDFDDSTLVGALNAVYGVTDYLKVVGSFGTAFRAPNIIERLFNGPTPEGAGFQILNPDLVSEESENFDLGLKYRRQNAVFEAIYFRNDIDKGIVQHFLSPAEIAQLPAETQRAILESGVRFVVQQRNIDRLRYEGVEVIVGYRTPQGIVLGGNLTHLTGKRRDTTNPPTGDSVADKYNAYVRYEPPSGRYWLEYRVRHNGDQRANLDPGEPVPPVGEILPSFTIHALSGGVTLFERDSFQHSLTVVVQNLSDELYAEFSNATFFRPQPKQSVTASYRVRF